MPPNRGWVMIAHDNFYRRPGAVITYPTSAAGFDARRLRDRLACLSWKPGGGSALEDYRVDLGAGVVDVPDYVAIYGTNAGLLSGSVAVRSSPDNITWSTLATFSFHDAASLVVTEDPFAFGVTPVRYWGLRFAPCTAAGFQVAEAILGRKCDIPWHPRTEGFSPAAEAWDREESVTEAGNLLRARLLSAARETVLDIPLAPKAWADSMNPKSGLRYWWENVALAGRPFSFHWAAALVPAYPRDGYLARCDSRFSRVLASPSKSGPLRLRIVATGVRDGGL